MLIVLPLYPNWINGHVYSVNLFAYTAITSLNRSIYWCVFISLIVSGIIKILLTRFNIEKGHRFVTDVSMGINILLVMILAMTKEAYAITVAFLLIVIKGLLLLKSIKTDI